MYKKSVCKQYIAKAVRLGIVMILGFAGMAYAETLKKFGESEKVKPADLNKNFSLLYDAVNKVSEEPTQGPVGPMGPQGFAGPQGIQGPPGPEGAEGPRGDKGDPGAVGLQGIQGPPGPEGPAGLKGDKGDPGAVGPQGIQGPAGAEGPEGPKGDKGEPGFIGPQGMQGLQGPAGSQGPMGIAGPPGPDGPQGPVGPIGPKGDQGKIGETGPRGEKGERGSLGPQGPIGPPGSPDSADRVREKFFYGTSCTNPMNPNDAMVRVGPLCVDKFEASVFTLSNGTGTQYGVIKDDYPASFPDNGNWTTPLFAVSKGGVTPSRHITWFQAQQSCALSGKRLLTNAEWQMAASGTPDSEKDDSEASCAISSALSQTGSRATCKSNFGVHDMVGNLSEWVADWIQNNGKADGGSVSTQEYGQDGIYSVDEAAPAETRFPSALVRGGHFTGGTVSGIFSLTASVGPSYSNEKFGFRCAR